jgi:hypothetical protein
MIMARHGTLAISSWAKPENICQRTMDVCTLLQCGRADFEELQPTTLDQNSAKCVLVRIQLKCQHLFLLSPFALGLPDVDLRQTTPRIALATNILAQL